MTPTQTLRVKPNGLPSGARIHVQAFQTRAALHAEILALRHQLLVLQLSSRDPQLPLGCADRDSFWVWLSRLGSGCLFSLAIVNPEIFTLSLHDALPTSRAA